MIDAPLSLYIHVPWCERKCPYCDFNSHNRRGDIDQIAYIDSLLLDLDTDLAEFENHIGKREVQSIFIGGGTPSLFDPKSYQRLFRELNRRLKFANDIEITLEANPGSSEMAKFAGFRDAGINRLSIGVQSFNADHLKSLGRIHSSEQALNAAEFARNAGFDNLNLDIMFGLPEQSLEQALADAKTAIDLNPNHLSCYQLTIEPNTAFHHQPPITPDNDALWEMQCELQKIFADNGYQHYEVSAYSKPGQACRHNLNYWRFGDYLGIGAGAHAKLSIDDKVIRRWKIKHPASYMKNANKIGATTEVAKQQLPFEFMMNALRLNAGFELADFAARTGLPTTLIEPVLNKHLDLQLIERQQDHIRPTPFGHNMLNSMLEDYLELPV